MGELLPAVGGGAEHVGGVVVEVLGGLLGILGVEVLPGLFNHGELGDALVEEVVAGGFEGLAVDAPTQRGEAVGLAELPEGGIVVLGTVAAELHRSREVGIAAEDGEAGALAGVVEGYPSDAADLVGEPVAELDDGAVGAPGDADGAGPLHGGVAHGIEHGELLVGDPGVGDGRDDAVRLVLDEVALLVLALGVGDLVAGTQVEGRTLIVAAEETRDVLDAHLSVGLDADGEVLDGVRQIQRGCQLLHDVELASAVVLDFLLVVGAAVGFPEAEGLLAVPELEPAGDVKDVVGRHVVVGVAEVKGTDAGDVGRDGNLVVGDADGSPDATDALGTLAEDLKEPRLLLVGNSEALAAVTVAIFLDQLPHEADGIARCGATLQGDAGEFLDHEDALLVAQGVAATDGGLAHGKLLLVEAGIGGVEEAIGVSRLWDGARLDHASDISGRAGVEAVTIDGGDRVALIVAGGGHGHPGAVTGIAGVGGDDRAVGTCLFAHHDAGAGFGHALQSILGIDCH